MSLIRVIKKIEVMNENSKTILFLTPVMDYKEKLEDLVNKFMSEEYWPTEFGNYAEDFVEKWFDKIRSGKGLKEYMPTLEGWSIRGEMKFRIESLSAIEKL